MDFSRWLGIIAIVVLVGCPADEPDDDTTAGDDDSSSGDDDTSSGDDDTSPGDDDATSDDDDTGAADADGDGWSVEDGDCDDGDPAVHPDATDLPYDGLDQDCSGFDLCAIPEDAGGGFYWADFEGAGAAAEMLDFCSDYPDGATVYSVSIDAADSVDLSELSCLCGATRMSVMNNELLTSTDGLLGLRYVETSFYISGNSALASLQGLQSLTEVAGDESGPDGFYIGANTALDSLDGLSALQSVGGTLDISTNGISDLTGLDSLTYVGSLAITYGPALVSMQGLEGIQTIGGGSSWEDGHVWIHHNQQLASVAGLDALAETTGSIYVYDNALLDDLAGLSSLELVGGSLLLRDNAILEDFAGLGQVDAIGGDLEIDANAALLDVSALHGVQSVGTDLLVTDNTSLPTASAEALRDAIGSIGGEVQISGNAP